MQMFTTLTHDSPSHDNLFFSDCVVFFNEPKKKPTMAKGASQSQSSSTTSRTSGDAPRGSAAASAGMRRRRGGGGSAGLGGGKGGSGVGGGSSNMLRFYTDDAPGLKMTPTVVLVMSLLFIGFVTTLHVFGKVYRYKSAASGEA